MPEPQAVKTGALTDPFAQIFEHLFGRILGEDAAELAAIVGHQADVFDDEIINPPLVVLGDQAEVDRGLGGSRQEFGVDFDTGKTE